MTWKEIAKVIYELGDKLGGDWFEVRDSFAKELDNIEGFNYIEFCRLCDGE